MLLHNLYLCSDLVTAFIHYFPTSKLLILSSATLELALICLTALLCSRSCIFWDVRSPARSVSARSVFRPAHAWLMGLAGFE